jgi:hypothetical protein
VTLIISRQTKYITPACSTTSNSIFSPSIIIFSQPLLKRFQRIQNPCHPLVSSLPAPGAYITRPQASTPFQSVFVFACPPPPSLPFSCSCACIG